MAEDRPKNPTEAYGSAEKRIQQALMSDKRNLDLSGLGLAKLPEAVGKLTQLKELHLYQNQLTTLPASVRLLTRLESLRLDDNQLPVLPDCIAELRNLRRLYVDGNSLTALPAWFGSLAKLDTLSLSENSIRLLPESFRALVHLRRLSLSINQLAELPDWIDELKGLQDLYLYSNRLSRLPDALRALADNLRHLFLHNNPALNLPPEVLGPTSNEVTNAGMVAARPADILDFYFRLGKRPLNEAKIILLGRGEAGKTSIVNRLVHDTFVPTFLTHGIQITPWQVTINADQIRLYVWDFGGQEIQHATHKFFLTERSLYLVVLNGRVGSAEEDAEYWLKFVKTFGGSSPTIVVLNKFREEPFQVNRRGLQEPSKYPFITAFVETDCEPAADKGIQELRRSIEAALANMNHVREGFPAEWFKIKDRLAEMPARGEPYISFAAYRNICQSFGEGDRQAQERLARFLNALGIALNFRDDPQLREETVLNPHWITDAVYKIITSAALAERKGEVRQADLRELLPAKEYPPQMHGFLIELMRKFELCFPFHDDSTEHRYLVPELLGVEEPSLKERFAPEECLNFRYGYGLMPEGLLPRFITRTHTMSQPAERWRTGVVLRWEGSRALVKADKHNREVLIRVMGEPEKQRRLLGVIRENFDRIHFEMKEFKPTEWIALDVKLKEDPQHWVSCEKLETFERNHEREFREALGDRVVTVQVGQMLARTDVPRFRGSGDGRGREERPLRLFISYAREDDLWRDKLAPNLGLLKRQELIEVWCDLEIVPGGNWDQQIKQRLEEADLYMFLMSTDLLNSDYVQSTELPIARKRHDEGNAVLVPVVVRPCNWKHFVGGISALPKDGLPMKSWRDKDEACLDVENGLRKTIEEARKKLVRK